MVSHLLSSLLVWSGHPPPISYSRHTKLSKYILWLHLSGWMGVKWVLQHLSPFLQILTPPIASGGYNLSVRTHLWCFIHDWIPLGLTLTMWVTVALLSSCSCSSNPSLPFSPFSFPLHSHHFLSLYTHSHPFYTSLLPYNILLESLTLVPLPIFTFLLLWWMLFACISVLFHVYIINNFI